MEEKDADIIALDTDNYSFKQQIDNLRQQLKSQPAEIAKKIMMKLPSRCYGKDLFKNILKEVLKEYQQ